MISNVDLAYVPDFVINQLSNFFPIDDIEKKCIVEITPVILNKVETCFYGVDNKYFHRGEQVFFSPFHSGQWLIFLYYLANYISTKVTFPDNKVLADKVYYLNKILHSVDVYHEVELPTSFFLEHPVGTVLGRASYKDGFMAYQNCTVGGNKGHYPSLGENFRMMSGSKILGNSRVGNNVTLAANTYVKDTDIPDGATVFGSSPNLVFKFLK